MAGFEEPESISNQNSSYRSLIIIIDFKDFEFESISINYCDNILLSDQHITDTIQLYTCT